MEKYMNNILKKTEELIDTIKKSNDYQEYLRIKQIIKNDKEIMELIDNVKSLQKRIVKEQIKNNDISNLEQQIEEKLKKLDSFPIYNEFNNLQYDINNCMQIIKNTIENHLNDITN